ncbi:putative UPF0481 protein At3g02645 [Eucalyptus grandis]|uniref:putative UPF0481 protein At3g02645 n=1 Tax=Eucalyptus grandis TaxID=71139 RepID=UPI00192E9378|nr:putative UPF0481 protein At3g02645 [Eucalyptus grandis]
MSLSSTETKEWLDRVQKYFEEEFEKDIAPNVCVFKVPKSLSSAKPEAYTPQLIGLGPYHHLQPQLREMERVKLSVVKRLHRKSDRWSFSELTSKLSKLDLYVRACYHKFLDIDAKALSWIMTLDALFLFYLLCLHAMGKKIEPSSPLWGLANSVGKKLAEDAILRDVMMLENQIPLFFLENMVKVGSAALEDAERKTIEENFPGMLVGFCKAVSPLEETIKEPDPKGLKHAHLLDLLYSMVVRKEDEFKIDIPADTIDVEEDLYHPRDMVPTSNDIDSTARMEFLTKSGFKLPSFKDKIRPHALLLQDIMKILPQKIELSTLDSFGRGEAPAVEKGLIPTASSLAKAGVRFGKTKYIEETSFDEKTRTFRLPVIKLSINSEVVIRNLVAYEAMAISGPLVLARFMEMMDSLLDTPQDVKLLRKHGIITGHLKDDEVAHLFNGMSRSMEAHGHCQLNKTIEKVNQFYNARPSIKALKMIEQYVYGAWKVLVTAATLLFLLLTALQTFCSAYSYSSLAAIDKLNPIWPWSPRVSS